ncbi:CAP1 [Coprinopsis cinerea okayama7|uniref:CAP1 n=1 Tax=Coprinopsis cinerea (strain Okayama-7 / 130 / ATCC MYA-4618 / FGSC 9003) TaxID=240176 RepID=A8N9I2_COPC7|nr:CAP1 [Coprinopsis cinerea okayama7\|eukprot:XP_001831488.2 CAP1 [Coprinopsis cinerea okayama7\
MTKTQTTFIKTTVTKTIVPAEATSRSGPRPLDAFGFPIYDSSKRPGEHEAVPFLRRDGTSEPSLVDRPPESRHFYRPDGLVEVNPNGPHPIFELIEKGEREWKRKHDRASRTLKEACAEYKRRYGRRPPKGFEKWWAYVQKYQVQLPDEYDQIHRDLEPFFAFEPLMLQWIEYEWEGHADSFTIGKEEIGSPLDLLNFTLPESGQIRHELAKGANMIIDLMKEVEEDLPVFRRDAIEAAKRGEYLDLSQPREQKHHGWKTACPPFSPIWADPLPYSIANGVTTPPTLRQLEQLKYSSPHSNYSGFGPHPKTFIHDHAATLSPCEHPAHLLMHGQFLRYGHGGPVPLREKLANTEDLPEPVYYGMVPYFSYSPTRLHDDIVAAVPMGWVDDVYPRSDDPPFDEKPDSRLHWRGRNTGMWCGNDNDVESLNTVLGKTIGGYNPKEKHTIGPDRAWWLSQRGRLVDWANRMWEGLYEVEPAQVPHSLNVGVPHEIWKRSTVPEFEDDLFVGPMPNDTSLHGRRMGGSLRKGKTLPAHCHAGVLRSPPSPEYRLAAPPDKNDDTEWIGHESPPLSKSDWSPAMCDIAFVGSPLNCEGRMCDKVGDMYEFRKVQGGKEQGRYKFVMDVDGNGWSSRFKRLITSNSLIFKSTVYPEWFTDRIQPWVHYVPIQLDLSDLLDTLYFFRGDPSQHNHHLDLAAKMADAGRQWSKRYWRKEDMVAYMFRLFLEYARVMGDEFGRREDYVYREADEVKRGEMRSEDAGPQLSEDAPLYEVEDFNAAHPTPVNDWKDDESNPARPLVL